MIDGSHILNFALRQLRQGHRPSLERVTAQTEGYASHRAPHRNTFWLKKDLDPSAVLEASPPASPLHVVSSGGRGFRKVARWLGDDTGEARQSHRRLPPLAPAPGQQFVYVFGDPRNVVPWLFRRRLSLSQRPGADCVSGRSFVLRRAAKLEVDVEPMDADWDLPRYFKQGFDLFRLEEHFDYWYYGDLSYPMLFVRFKNLATSADVIGRHLGHTLSPIATRPNRPDWRDLPEALRDRVETIYGDFAARLSELPDAFTVAAARASDLQSGEPATARI